MTSAPSPEAMRWGRNSLVPLTTPCEVDPDDPVEVLVGHVLEVARDIETPALLTRRLTRPNWPTTSIAHCAMAARSETSTTSLRTSAPERLDDVDGLGEAVGVPVGEREQGALLGGLAGHLAAHAAAGAGDDDDLVPEVLGVRSGRSHAGSSRRSGRPRGRTSRRRSGRAGVRKVNVARGHSVVFLPWASRYQLEQPPVDHTVRRIRRWRSPFQSSWAARRGSTAAYRCARIVVKASSDVGELRSRS